VEHLTLDLTAEVAGISKGGLLYHFPHKEALIQGMIQYYLERFNADFNTAADEGGASAGRWTHAYLHTTYEDNQRNPHEFGLLAAVATNPALLTPMQQTFAEWVGLLEQDGLDATTAQIIRWRWTACGWLNCSGWRRPIRKCGKKFFRRSTR
jgi:AcrR family transcriptional regulator